MDQWRKWHVSARNLFALQMDSYIGPAYELALQAQAARGDVIGDPVRPSSPTLSEISVRLKTHRSTALSQLQHIVRKETDL